MEGLRINYNLMSTGETIKQVWIGDPSRFALLQMVLYASHQATILTAQEAKRL
ncbi:hypothetical protein [Nostoc sp. KVJ3]|uniref:hypothetical protein n=1 Tax=Nostoc sp. KVJ3 TaxID=457945 RepID=UPI002238AD1D|nr:hypothetical protein [Nostoc sp. KVJ3]